MPFIVDRKNFRTYDPERGYELFSKGGGSGGTLYFRLVGPNAGPDGVLNFMATFKDQKMNDDEIRRLGANYDEKNTVVWDVTIPAKVPDDLRKIIREAMLAYKIAHGSPLPDLKAFVRFGPKGGIFEECTDI